MSASPQPQVSDEATATDAPALEPPTEVDDLSASESDEPAVGAPPPPDVVALRTLAVAALLQRASYEVRPGRASEVRQLQGWVDAFGLFAGLGAGALELFDATHGAWSQEERASVAWLAEELRVLSWALGLEPALPPVFERSAAGPLVKQVPLLEPPQAFVGAASLRAVGELDGARAFYDTLLEAMQSEAWARALLEEPALVDEDVEALESMFEGAGLHRSGAEDAAGRAAAAVTGLRAWSRLLLEELFAEGSPHAAFAFDAGLLEAMEPEPLGTALALARTRARALEWLTEGDEALDESDDADAGPETA